MLNVVAARDSLARSRRIDPLRGVRLTRPQRAVVEDTAQVVLWRDGNQLGKSYALAYVVVAFALRLLPIARRFVGPLSVMVIGYSYGQMDPLLGKIWSMLPKDRIDPNVSYIRKQGFKGYKQQHVTIYTDATRTEVAAIIHLGTYEAGASAIMGDSVHLVVLDEPPPSSVFDEALARISFFAGFLRIGFTPTPDAPPLEYLREAVAAGEIHEHNYGLSHATCTIHEGRIPLPLRRQADIDAWARKLPRAVRPMRVSGSWDCIHEGQQLDAFDEVRHVQGYALPLDGWDDITIGAGTDHGIQPGRQASLIGCTDGHRIWIVAEYRPKTRTNPKQDARGIIEALDRAGGWTVADVDVWAGDRAAEARAWGARKANGMLRDELARAFGKPADEIGKSGLWIHTPHKSTGSAWLGVHRINALFDEERLFISPDCVEIIKSIKGWTGDKKDPCKDLLDALHYLIDQFIEENALTPPQYMEAA